MEETVDNAVLKCENVPEAQRDNVFKHPSSVDQTYVVRVDDDHLPDVVSFNNVHVL